MNEGHPFDASPWHVQEQLAPGKEMRQAWRDGNLLVLSVADPIAPDRCIFTNEPVYEHRKMSRLLSLGPNGPANGWMPTGCQLLFAASGMRFLTVRFGFGERMKLRRKLVLMLSFIAMVGGAVSFALGVMNGFPPLLSRMGIGAAVLVVALTIWVNAYSVLDVVAMDVTHVWLRGAKPAFLDSLPVFIGKRPPRK